MKRRNKFTLGLVALGAAAFFASGCTANFCTNKEKSRIAYALDQGATEFVLEGSKPTEKGKNYEVISKIGKVEQVVTYTVKKEKNKETKVYERPEVLNNIISGAKSSSIALPAWKYFYTLDVEVLNMSVKAYNKDVPVLNKEIEAYNKGKSEKNQKPLLKEFDFNNPDQKALNALREDYGYLKFYDSNKDDAFNGFRNINSKLREEGYTKYATIDFENHYISSMESLTANYHSCITVYDEVKYGNYGAKATSITLEKVTWGDAWGKGGHLIEGLIVYPVAWLIDTFALMFAGGKAAGPAAISNAYATGGPQILAIVVVTVIVRLFIFLVTFKSTLTQRKMTELQPELAKIQQKYPNANTNQAQKQRMAEEQMRLYKKHKVNPLSQLLVLIVQFPIFIGVWGAMTGSAVLSTGQFLGLHLSDSIWATLKMGPANHGGWWTALVLILLMSAGQFFSMKVPQWIQKARAKKVARLGKNPAQKQQNRTANIVSYAMLIMIIIMGFTLPAAMGVYWFVGAIVSLIQTVFTTVIFGKPKKKN